MTDGTKKVLIVGGVAVAAYFGWKYVTSQSAVTRRRQSYFSATNPESGTAPYNPNINVRYRTTIEEIRNAERSAENAYGNYSDTANSDRGYLRS